MDIQQAYNTWAEQYDSNQNKTRDLEKNALQATLANFSFEKCLEMGCGTGKNTAWLSSVAKHVVAIDFSEEMLKKARQSSMAKNVVFQQADISKDWDFISELFDLVSFSLVLEHFEDLNIIFQKAAKVLAPNGFLYVGELHPFKQYTGSTARFDTPEGRQILTCFTHHISDFVSTAQSNGLLLVKLNEYFDDNDSNQIPRILTLVFRKD